jgi:hypothetical protein
MGRLTQMIHFLNSTQLPLPYERLFIYTKIGKDEELKSLRKKIKTLANQK